MSKAMGSFLILILLSAGIILYDSKPATDLIMLWAGCFVGFIGGLVGRIIESYQWKP